MALIHHYFTKSEVSSKQIRKHEVRQLHVRIQLLRDSSVFGTRLSTSVLWLVCLKPLNTHRLLACRGNSVQTQEEWEFKGCQRGRVSVRGKSPNCGRVPMVGTVHDASTWETLKRVCPKYAAFETAAEGPPVAMGAVEAALAGARPQDGCRRRLAEAH